jgi:hypothetical protein
MRHKVLKNDGKSKRKRQEQSGKDMKLNKRGRRQKNGEQRKDRRGSERMIEKDK